MTPVSIASTWWAIPVGALRAARSPLPIRSVCSASPTFLSSSLDVERLRTFAKPVLFALGGLSNPDYYAREAERAREIFPDFTLEVFAERHHFDPPHRLEPERTAEVLRRLWARAS